VLVGLSPDEVDAWTKAYTSDALFAEVLEASQEDQESQAKYSQYLVKPNGLIYFEDRNGNERLCVRVSVMSSVAAARLIASRLQEAALTGFCGFYDHM
jgi:hypothetical protein